MKSPLADALSRLKPALDSLGIRYVIVGSLASSTHGIGRSTVHGDLLARIVPSRARPLLAGLGQEWYGDVDEIEPRSWASAICSLAPSRLFPNRRRHLPSNAAGGTLVCFPTCASAFARF